MRTPVITNTLSLLLSDAINIGAGWATRGSVTIQPDPANSDRFMLTSYNGRCGAIATNPRVLTPFIDNMSQRIEANPTKACARNTLSCVWLPSVVLASRYGLIQPDSAQRLLVGAANACGMPVLADKFAKGFPKTRLELSLFPPLPIVTDLAGPDTYLAALQTLIPFAYSAALLHDLDIDGSAGPAIYNVCKMIADDRFDGMDKGEREFNIRQALQHNVIADARQIQTKDGISVDTFRWISHGEVPPRFIKNERVFRALHDLASCKDAAIVWNIVDHVSMIDKGAGVFARKLMAMEAMDVKTKIQMATDIYVVQRSADDHAFVIYSIKRAAESQPFYRRGKLVREAMRHIAFQSLHNKNADHLEATLVQWASVDYRAAVDFVENPGIKLSRAEERVLREAYRVSGI